MIDAFIEGVRSNGPRLLLIEGAPGIGKSTLWNALADRAERQGLTVLRSRPSMHETTMAFAGLMDLLAAVQARFFERLFPPQRRALEAALLRRDLDGRSLDRRGVSAAVLSVAQAVATAGPVLIAVDDAQWLDLPTIRALEFAIRRLDAAPVGIVIARRSGDDGRSASLVTAVGEQRRIRISLGPLPASDVEALIVAESRSRLPRNVVRAIGRASDGNPMLAREIAGELARSGTPVRGEPLPLPDSLRELVARRVERLSSRTKEALFVASNLSRPIPALVERVLPGATASLEAAFRANVTYIDAGLIRFGHPLYASAVETVVRPERRRELHAAMADASEDPEERAQHLALAAQGPDEGIAAALERAASRAQARGAPESVAAMLDRALTLTPGQRADAIERRSVSAAAAHLQAGDMTEARELLEAVVRDAPGGARRAEALHLLAEVRYLDDSYEEALPYLEQAVSEAGSDSRLCARIHLDLALARFNSGDVAAALVHTDAALVHAKAMPDDGLKAAVLASASLVSLSNGRGVDNPLLARALELEDWDEALVVYFRPSYCAAFIAGLLGDVQAACEHLEVLRRELATRGLDADVVTIAVQTVQAECMRGAVSTAVTVADEAVAMSDALGGPLPRANALAAKAWAAAWQGKTDDAEAAANEALRLLAGTGGRQQAMYAAAALGFVALSRGDHDAARRSYEPFVAMMGATGGPPEPGLTWAFLPDAVEPLVSLGDLAAAEQLTSYLEVRGAALGRPWAAASGARCRSLLIAAGGDLLAAEAKLDAALGQYETLGMPLDVARTLLLLGRVRRRGRRRAAARDALRRAVDAFEQHGASLWADQARREAARLGIRRAPDQLSETEERVARLIASGLTVRAVAAALFVSPKTVESSLYRVYGKLGVSSRAELGARMATDGTVESGVGSARQK